MQLPTYSMYAHLFKRKSNILFVVNVILVDVLSEVYLILLCAEREREREREREKERKRVRERECVCLCVCVFVFVSVCVCVLCCVFVC